MDLRGKIHRDDPPARAGRPARSSRGRWTGVLLLAGLLLAAYLALAPQDCLNVASRIMSGTILEQRVLRPDLECYVRRNSVHGAAAPKSVLDSGPLRPSPANPRYFMNGNGRIVLLAGSHTWSNLQDVGDTDPPGRFDYALWLDFLRSQNHNFFRLWTWEQAKWSVESAHPQYADPLPYARTVGGGEPALDGKSKFDLTKFNQAYFDRLRQRIVAAGERGIYVSVMLFNGWSVAFPKGSHRLNNPWQGHPFNAMNNVNGVPGQGPPREDGIHVHELGDPRVTALQEAYVRKVIDTVNDLDNVLFEISNESHSGSIAWQYHMIDFIHRYEARKPKQHPVGMTVPYPDGRNADLFASGAEWVSPKGDLHDRPIADGAKIVVADTDHLCGLCGDAKWVWASFTRGENLLFMDRYDNSYPLDGTGYRLTNRNDVALRKNLGFARQYAHRMNLAAAKPRVEVASSRYALANPGSEYLVFIPDGRRVTVELGDAKGELGVEWFEPATGRTVAGAPIHGGARRSFEVPFPEGAVLYLATMDRLNRP